VDLKEFEQYLDARGSDWSNWPESIRDQAQSLVSELSEARQLFEEVEEFDILLAKGSVVSVPTSLRNEIFRRTIRKSSEAEQSLDAATWIDSIFAHIWRPIAVAFLPLAIGLAVGFFDQIPVDDLEVEIVELTFTDYQAFASNTNGP